MVKRMLRNACNGATSSRGRRVARVDLVFFSKGLAGVEGVLFHHNGVSGIVRLCRVVSA